MKPSSSVEIAVDSSVAIAAFASWHEQHRTAVEICKSGPSLPAHAAVEVYSVLTRLPEPHRSDPAIVIEFLRRQFPRRLVLGSRRQRTLAEDAAALGVSAGAVYDAVIAFTCIDAAVGLASFDARARETYFRCGVELVAHT